MTTGETSEEGRVASGVASSLMTLTFLFVLAVLIYSVEPPHHRLQPATLDRRFRRRTHQLASTGNPLVSHLLNFGNREDSIVLDTLRVLGLARRSVERPVSGPKAYTRWWERLRAVIGLIVLVTILGIVLAVATGIALFGFLYLLEQGFG